MTASGGRTLLVAFGLWFGWVTPGLAATPADLLLVNGRVYTFTWDEPGQRRHPRGQRSALGLRLPSRRRRRGHPG